MRAFAIVLGFIVGFLALVGAGGAYWWHKNGDTIVTESRAALGEGRRRGSTVDETACVAETLQHQRAATDGSFSEGIARSVWLHGCLDSSRVAPSFCEGVPADRELMKVGTWVAATCLRLGSSGQDCHGVYQEVARYCASPQRAAKLAGPST